MRPHSRGPLARSEGTLRIGLAQLRRGQDVSAWQHLMRCLDLNPDARTEQVAREALTRMRFARGGRL